MSLLLSALLLSAFVSAMPAPSPSAPSPSPTVLPSAKTVPFWPWSDETGNSREDDSLLSIPQAIQDIFGIDPIGTTTSLPSPTHTKAPQILPADAFKPYENTISTPAPTSTSTSTPSPTPGAHTTISKHKLAIIGAVIGAIMALILLVTLAKFIAESRGYRFKLRNRDRRLSQRVASVFSHESWGMAKGSADEAEVDHEKQQDVPAYAFPVKRNRPAAYHPVPPISNRSTLLSNKRSTLASNKRSTFASTTGKRSTLMSIKTRLSRLLSSSTFDHRRDTITTQDTQSTHMTPFSLSHAQDVRLARAAHDMHLVHSQDPEHTGTQDPPAQFQDHLARAQDSDTTLTQNQTPTSTQTHHGRTKSAPVLSQLFQPQPPTHKTSKSVRFTEVLREEPHARRLREQNNGVEGGIPRARWEEEIARANDGGSRYDIVSAYAYARPESVYGPASGEGVGVRGVGQEPKENINDDLGRRGNVASTAADGRSRVSQYGYQW
ncbi:hypothetical protein BV22DRAFT_1029697 [Leucogyrophana mollusca]|uniref:Uncharacterized protein n=1 Tax=Leucogyrophana mollusca TaxID=85980 RepID=A0ACB8BUW0_9AGAM|nr:hypothetical protein BV22DRAFT_1029697 [Leucogyrophana mollusca]